MSAVTSQPQTPQSEAEAEWVELDAVHPWPMNPYEHSDAQVRAIMESIQTFGWMRPILARRENGEISAGHGTYAAAKRLGMAKVLVRFVDLDEDTSHAYALADNELAKRAVRNDAHVAEIVEGLQSRGHDALLAIALQRKDISQLLSKAVGSGSGTPPEPQLDHIDALRTKWNTELGQRWVIPSESVHGREHVLLVGDATIDADVKRLMRGMRAECMWTDPPYGVAYEGKTQNALRIKNDKLSVSEFQPFLEAFLNVAARRALIAGAAAYVAHPAGPRSLEFRLAFDAAGFRFHEGLVWNKGTMVLGHSDYHYSHEPIMFGYAPGGGRRGRGGEGWYGDSSQVSVFDVPKPKANPDHPTPKPPDLIVAMLKNSCPVEGTVYDPFAGSGSTLVAAESIQRVAHGIELDPRYAAVTLQRFADMGLTPTLDASE
jgi:DNA modification methylase